MAERPNPTEASRRELQTGEIHAVCAAAADIIAQGAIEHERSLGRERRRLINAMATMAAAGVATDQLDQTACDTLRRGLGASFALIAEQSGSDGFQVVRAAGPVALGPLDGAAGEVAAAATRVPLATAGEHLAVAVPGHGRGDCVLVARLKPEHSLTDLELSFVEEITLLLALTHAQQRQRELEQQLLRARRLEAVGRLAGGIAHDFNNLLAVILNYASFVSEAVSEEAPELRADVREITYAANRAAELTRRLLVFARGESAPGGSCNARRVIRELAAVLRVTGDRTHQIQVELAEPGWGVGISEDELEQVATALVANAREAMPEGGRLIITGEASASEVRISFIDEGTGMTPRVAESALDPFFTTKPAGHGTGLGLSAVHGIVSRAGGRVVIDSAPGRGSNVTIVLPRVADRTVREEDGAGTLDASSSSRTVLVVDDQDPLREAVRRILESGGYRVLDVSSVATARDVLSASGDQIDLLLTDVLLPGESVIDLATHVDDVCAGKLPIVFMSGFSGGMLEGLGGGRAFGLIRKPFTGERLLHEVQVALERAGSRP